VASFKSSAWLLRPQGALEERQLAAAFENIPMCPFLKGFHESGSKLPHSEGFASQ
jgi:hypothetical protein